MIIPTHKKIAKAVFNQFSEEIKGLVCRKSFIGGAIFPDINIKHSRKEHSYDQTFTTFNKILSDVLNRNLSRKTFSHKLGILCHYISDYCCAYHSNINCRRKSIVEHLIYEYKLDKYSDARTPQYGI